MKRRMKFTKYMLSFLALIQLVVCTAMDVPQEDSEVTFITSDDQRVGVKKSIVEKFKEIKFCLTDVPGQEILLPNVSKDVLNRLVDFLKWGHLDESLSLADLIELSIADDYLDIEPTDEQNEMAKEEDIRFEIMVPRGQLWSAIARKLTLDSNTLNCLFSTDIECIGLPEEMQFLPLGFREQILVRVIENSELRRYIPKIWEFAALYKHLRLRQALLEAGEPIPEFIAPKIPAYEAGKWKLVEDQLKALIGEAEYQKIEQILLKRFNKQVLYPHF